ncbi:MAG: PIN domain-containing protein [Nitrospira sp.]
MATFTALYDACVLYPAPLRDLLLELALTDLFRAKWSSHIHDEWIRAVLQDRPDLTAVQLRRTRDLMDLHARDCLVEDFEDLIPSLTLPDSNDRHVLAAAIRGRADVIVTYNLTDFPEKELQKYGITPQHPDEFLLHLFNLGPSLICAAASTHRARLKHPPKTTTEYLDTLERQSLTQFVAALRPHAARL